MSNAAISFAYIGMDSGLKWIYFGWVKERLSGSTNSSYKVRLEIQDGSYNPPLIEQTLPDNPSNTFNILYNPTNGAISAYLNGTQWYGAIHSSMAGLTFTNLVASGEVNLINSQMPGTSTNKTQITGAQFLQSGTWQNINFTSTNLFQTDPAKFGSETNASGINVWDKRP